MEKTMNQKISDQSQADKKLILVDFDGVLHSYKSGWQGVDVIPDPPIEGAIEWLEQLTEVFDVRIFSARCNDAKGIHAMIAWFYKHDISHSAMTKIKFEPGKPSAFLIIDDRAINFGGLFSEPGRLAQFEPWYYDIPEYGRK
jgi:hypothetical protein